MLCLYSLPLFQYTCPLFTELVPSLFSFTPCTKKENQLFLLLSLLSSFFLPACLPTDFHKSRPIVVRDIKELNMYVQPAVNSERSSRFFFSEMKKIKAKRSGMFGIQSK